MAANWGLVYRAACSEQGLLPREELKDTESVDSIVLNGNCKERFSSRVDDAETAALCQAVSQTDCVTELDLSYSNVTDEGARHIAGLLKTSSSLQYLSLQYNSITSRGWRLIAQSAMENNTLLGLNVAGNAICGDDPANRESGGKIVGMLLRANRTLQVLNLKACGLGVNALVGVAQALTDHPSLLSLNIANPIMACLQERASVAQHLAEMIKKNGVLQELDLSRMMLSDATLQTMLPALVANDSIRALVLSANKLSCDGGVDVAKVLARRHDIVLLNLSSNEIGNAGAAAVAQTLRASSMLQHLSLAHCAIAEDGLVAVAECLRTNTTLTSLFLWGNHWTPKACKVFYSIKTRLEELLEFDCEFQVVDGVPQVVQAAVV